MSCQSRQEILGRAQETQCVYRREYAHEPAVEEYSTVEEIVRDTVGNLRAQGRLA